MPADSIITTTMTPEPRTGLLRLLAWLSPGFPTGGYAYSHGLEWAVECGDIIRLSTRARKNLGSHELNLDKATRKAPRGNGHRPGHELPTLHTYKPKEGKV